MPALEIVECPRCYAPAGHRCTTKYGLSSRRTHVARVQERSRRLRETPSRWYLRQDDERFGLKAGDVLIGKPYWLDPDKVTVERRESDGFDPECNQYRVNLTWLGWAS